MWRKIITFLFLIVLAQSADALPFFENNKSKFNETALSTALIKTLAASIIDGDAPEKLVNLPRLSRLCPSLFSAEVQTSVNYVLVVEFLKITLNAAMFKFLSNPPDVISWFEQLSHNTNSSRLSGWKDGNFLYSARTTYHG